MEDIKIKIANGEYSINTRIEPVRELAIKYGVNPNTVQRALQELEKEEILHAERTSGRFITNDLERIDQCKTEMAEKYSEIYGMKLSSLILISENNEEATLSNKGDKFVRSLMIKLIERMTPDLEEQ